MSDASPAGLLAHIQRLCDHSSGRTQHGVWLTVAEGIVTQHGGAISAS